MKCKHCNKKTTGSMASFCDSYCKNRWLREKVSLQNQATFRLKGKDFFKRTSGKIHHKTLQAIWPKGQLAYKPNK